MSVLPNYQWLVDLWVEKQDLGLAFKRMFPTWSVFLQCLSSLVGVKLEPWRSHIFSCPGFRIGISSPVGFWTKQQFGYFFFCMSSAKM